MLSKYSSGTRGLLYTLVGRFLEPANHLWYSMMVVIEFLDSQYTKGLFWKVFPEQVIVHALANLMKPISVDAPTLAKLTICNHGLN